MAAENEILEFAEGTENDLLAIIEMLLDDDLGRTRESTSNVVDACYISAFQEISQDPNNEIVVGKIASKPVAVLQITYIPNLTLKGSKRALIEGVRVSASYRGRGIGHKLLSHAVERARINGCKLVQLTTNKSRVDAIHFYESLGFKATHEGFKLYL